VQPDLLGENLARHFSALSPQLQQAARYVMDHPEDVATHSLRQVAGKSGLTPPTFSRLARAIGYDEYEGLRQDCRDHLKQTRLSLAERAAIMQTDGDVVGDTFADRHIRAAASNIQALIDSLDANRLAEAADAIAGARRVLLVGFMSGGIMLDYLAYMAGLAASNWEVAGKGGKSFASSLAGLDSRDVVIVLSVAPYVRRTVETAQMVSQAGATTVSITDNLESPVLRHADHYFLVPTDSPQFFPSHIAIVALLEVIMGMVVQRLGDGAQKRIDAVEQTSHAIRDYW
jgi:DNA-binding MurR/RpiR family transcriptional regulator